MVIPKDKALEMMLRYYLSAPLKVLNIPEDARGDDGEATLTGDEYDNWRDSVYKL